MSHVLSVNINKFALLRNARGENAPDLIAIAKQCLDLGAHGITVHPRPDQRHIRYSDIAPLKELVDDYPGRELNIEGYPSPEFMALIEAHRPQQVTLVPDPPEALTSSFGWNIPIYHSFLKPIIARIHELGLRTSLFISPDITQLAGIETLSLPRAELYTYDYAHQYAHNREQAILPYQTVAKYINQHHIQLNAGHDLNLDNLSYFLTMIPSIQEVSIGHALVCDCLIYGLSTTLEKYLQCTNP